MLTLAIGVAAISFISAIAYGVLLRPLPYPRPPELVSLGTIDDAGRSGGVSLPDVKDWRERTTSFQGVTAFIEQHGALETPRGTQPVRIAAVDREFFEVLGVPAARGRMITAADERAPTIVLAWRTWQQLFGSSPAVIGESIRVNGETATVVGVAPADLTLPSAEVAAWIPLEHARQTAPPQWNMRGFRGFQSVGRLRTDQTIAIAAADVGQVAGRLASEYPRFNLGVRTSVYSLSQTLAAPVRQAVVLLWISAALLLMITCGNAASLSLTQAIRRRHEWAIRSALGARTAHIAVEMLTEASLLAGGGTVVGLLTGSGLVRWFATSHPEHFPRLEAVRMDAPVLAVSALIGFGAAVITAVGPVWSALRSDANEALKEARGPGARTRRLHRWVASAQTALSVMLVMATVLVARQLWTALTVDIGTSRSSILTARIDLTGPSYARPDAQRRFTARFLEAMAATPGTSVGLVSSLPPATGQMRTTLKPAGDPAAADVLVDIVSSTPGAFDVLGMTVVAGRGFFEADSAEAPPVAVLSVTAARLLFPGRDALGLRAPFGAPGAQPIVVGVVGDVRFRGVDAPAQAAMYVPAAQRAFRTMYVLVDSTTEDESSTRRLQEAVKQTDPDAALGEVQTLGALRAAAVSGDAFKATSIGTITASALFLAVIGVYGVASQSAALRRKEFAVRIALGGSRFHVGRLIFREAVHVCAVGAVAGMVLGMLPYRFGGTYLAGLPPLDISSAGIATIAALLIAAAAASVPALRAASAKPSDGLRG